MVPVIFLYQKTTSSHEVNHVQVFVWVRFFEARFVAFRRSQIESCKKKKTSSYKFLVFLRPPRLAFAICGRRWQNEVYENWKYSVWIRTNTRVADHDQQPSKAFTPGTYHCLLICLHICLHQHIAPPPPHPTHFLPRGRACLMSADKNQKCSIADKITTDIMP